MFSSSEFYIFWGKGFGIWIFRKIAISSVHRSNLQLWKKTRSKVGETQPLLQRQAKKKDQRKIYVKKETDQTKAFLKLQQGEGYDSKPKTDIISKKLKLIIFESCHTLRAPLQWLSFNWAIITEGNLNCYSTEYWI